MLESWLPERAGVVRVPKSGLNSLITGVGLLASLRDRGTG